VRRIRAISLFIALSALAGAVVGAGNWQPLKDDGLHDPSNPALEVLQEPGEALGVLAPDGAGNKVDWVQSLQQGLIAPRPSLDGEREPEIRETTVLMKNTYPMLYVRFPHKPHTQWMACETCHDRIFVPEVDANPINMGKILDGEYCGMCHGAVSFPLTECNRCHNTDPASLGKESAAAGEGAQ
jgi:c(7)-type cytochrome triheme protein